MIVYAESSAVLAWLLNEPDSATIRKALADAELVTASDLTVIECDRALLRARASHGLTAAEAARRRARLNGVVAHWNLLRIDPDVVERARRPFPGEPIRTLDAIHLASALVVRAAVEDLTLLSLDRRVRAAGTALGLALLPA